MASLKCYTFSHEFGIKIYRTEELNILIVDDHPMTVNGYINVLSDEEFEGYEDKPDTSSSKNKDPMQLRS
mgnify:CR=1 FL=1